MSSEKSEEEKLKLIFSKKTDWTHFPINIKGNGIYFTVVNDENILEEIIIRIQAEI